MGKWKRIVAALLGVLTSACASTPPLLASSVSTREGATPVSAAAVSETVGIYAELGLTGDIVDPRAVTPADLRTLDRNGDHQIGRAEIEASFAETLQQASAVGGPPAVPALLPTASQLPRFFVNPNLQPNQTELLIDDEQIFPEFFTLLRSAKRRIQMDFYILGGDLGMSIAQVLAQKASEGVAVELMIDPKQGSAGPTVVGIARVTEYLRKQKVAYRLYPLSLFGPMVSRLQDRFQIDHNKVLCVDETAALIGSMNLDDNARMNHDLMIRVAGPTATEISQMLATEWALGVDPTKMRTQAAGTSSLIRLSQTAPQEKTTRDLLLREIAGAQRSVHVAMFELSDQGIIDALGQAYRRGVDVRLLLDDGAKMYKYGFGAAPAGLPNLLPARDLLKAGAQVRWYVGRRKDQELHMKMAIIDGNKAVAGSTNWTSNAFANFRETSFVVQDGVATQFETMFLKDWAENSKRVDKLSLKQRIVARVVDYMNRHKLAFW